MGGKGKCKVFVRREEKNVLMAKGNLLVII
jgi:hypothetical protein